jgi:hypothetical protein
MWGYGPGGWDYFEIMGRIASVLVGSILFLIWLAVILLLVRFLLIATRAAKVYLRNNGAHDGIFGPRATPPAPAAPAASPRTTTTAPVTKPAPKPRTPKAP